ncbi:MAG: GTP-binding protein [Candidatus Odinarchaeota archaeon]
MTLFKINMIGDGTVGKTALLERYLTKAFHSYYLPTIGADFATFSTVVNGKKLKFQVWDIAGQPKWNSVRSIYYRGSIGAVLVYDITRDETYHNAGKWLEELFNHTGKGSVPVVLLANKEDLRDEYPNALTEEKGLILTSEINKMISRRGFTCSFFETSALTGQNVELAFKTLGEKVLTYLEVIGSTGKETEEVIA